MEEALIVIDYTKDFVADDGKLTCGKPAQEIEEQIIKLMKLYTNIGSLVVIANDIHKDNDLWHPESRLFPAHNIEGTEGRELYGRVGDVAKIISQAYSKRFYQLDKTRFSAFAGTDLEIKLRERGIKELHLAGVCTDICVLHTAIDAYNKGFKVVIHKDAVASFNQAGHEWALAHFENTLGFKVVEGVK